MRRSFNKEFKERVLAELAAGKPVAQICKEHELLPTLVSRWRREQMQNKGLAFAGKGNPAKTETKIAQLEQKVGQQAMEIDFINRVNKAMFEKIKEFKKNERRDK
jgi:transposase